MADMCGDNRFEIIEAAKKDLIEATNIETSPEEMAVLDNVLFRMWQMDWLPIHAHKVCVHSQGGGTHWVVCSHCEKPIDWQDAYCKHCGAQMDEEVPE